MLCVPILADDPATAKRDAILAAEKGADIVEFRVDLLMEADLSLEARIAQIKELVAESPLPCIVTCRPEWEGGLYAGGEDERVSMFEALGTADRPPAYIDVELKAYTASANIRQKINLAVDHPKQERHVRTRLILSSHDFTGRPADLTRKILAMQAEPACAVVKVAYRARSIRDNLELFDILSERQKPTIALGMGEFGLMSRVLAPKFGGFLTFASLRDESATAPGQPTIDDLLGMYRFRSIGTNTKVYGVIGWPVAQSMSPLIHNAGFESIGFDGVYLPLPIVADLNDLEASKISFRSTVAALIEHDELNFAGASVTIPHKENLFYFDEYRWDKQGPWLQLSPSATPLGVANTLAIGDKHETSHLNRGGVIDNTDYLAIEHILQTLLPHSRTERRSKNILVLGAGGVARAAIAAPFNLGCNVYVYNRNQERAEAAIKDYIRWGECNDPGEYGAIEVIANHAMLRATWDLCINCTPVGMAGGPDPDGLSIPIPDMPALPPETVFFDTVYNPIETPMLKAAKERGYRTIDGVQMFVRQAAAQFELWTGHPAPVELFDRLVRERLGRSAG